MNWHGIRNYENLNGLSWTIRHGGNPF